MCFPTRLPGFKSSWNWALKPRPSKSTRMFLPSTLTMPKSRGRSRLRTSSSSRCSWVGSHARQFDIARRPQDIEQDFGGTIGGPIKIPWLAWTDRKKTYAFFNYEQFIRRGGVTAPTVSIPSLKERAGDFTDWRDAAGNLIPIYDPATTRRDPNTGDFIRDQFMGCDGRTHNVNCPSDPRLQH